MGVQHSLQRNGTTGFTHHIVKLRVACIYDNAKLVKISKSIYST